MFFVLPQSLNKLGLVFFCLRSRTLGEKTGVLLSNSMKSWNWLFLSSITQECELHHYMATRDQAVTNHDATNQFTCVWWAAGPALHSSWLGCLFLGFRSYLCFSSLLDCLQLSFLPFKQISGCLKFPTKTRACIWDASCSWRKKATFSRQCLIKWLVLDLSHNLPL